MKNNNKTMKKKRKSFPKKKNLIIRLKQNISKNDGLIKLLELKKHKPIVINPKLVSNNKIEDNETKLAYEGSKIIEDTNNRFIKNKIKYENKRNENEDFMNYFKYYKSTKDKDIITEIEKKEYAFGKLLKAYEDKGISFQGNFFHKDIYNQSGILLRKKNLVEEYYEKQVKKEGVKGKKIIKYENFINKLLNMTKYKLILKKPFRNYKSKATRKLEEQKNLENQENDEKIKKLINKQIQENNLIKNLINLEEKNLQEKQIIKKLNLNGNDEKEKHEFISSITKSMIDEEDNLDENLENKNDFEINKSKNYKTVINEYNNETSTPMLILDSKDSLMFSKINKSLPSIQELNQKVLFNINNSSQTSSSMESSIFQARLKRKANSNLENSNYFPSLLSGIKNKRKSNLIVNYNFSNTEKSSGSLMSSQINKKNNSQPNLISAEKAYKKLLKYDMSSKRKKIKEILMNFYGDKINNFKADNKNKFQILNYFNKMKSDIRQSELKNRIYSKYKEILPEDFYDKIHLNNKLNEKLKNLVLNYSQSYCRKLNKLNGSEYYL